jgi:uncharacterized protein YndB with AHSA1/START domain
MENKFTARTSTEIQTSPAKVWDALTNPAMIRQYLFGTEAISDWKEGSPITYKGQWEGKSYEDKGVIRKVVPERIFQSTYWSSMSGTADAPENYAVVTYELEPLGGATRLTVTQDNCPSEESCRHSQDNWTMVLEVMRKLLESQQ